MASEAVLSTLRRGWQALEPLHVPMAVVGGLALAAWKHARYTRDADLLIAAEESALGAVLNALGAAGFYARHSPPVLVIDEQKIVQFGFLPPDGKASFQLDLLVANDGHQQAALARVVAWNIPGLDHPVLVLRPDDLILLKLTAGRIIDRADAAMLLRENRGEIDMQYLTAWVGRLSLDAGFGDIWREAFLDEPIPPSA
jgi:hypothetical protein